jgi:hypothetical protein
MWCSLWQFQPIILSPCVRLASGSSCTNFKNPAVKGGDKVDLWVVAM